jgi:hypothetical protein
LLEVWQNPDRNPAAIKGFLQFMTEICQLASRFLRNRLMRQMAGQQALWTQLEAFTRQIHKSLNPVETAYVIANEGRRIIDCDRLSVAVRYARRCTVEAVSGADVVEKRSNLVQLMRTLFDKVLAWGEKLVYTGTKDEGLPPQVHQALDAYLAESNSKLLVVMPLVEESEKESKKTPRSALLMECFEPAVSPEQLIARLDMIGKHAVSSLYNGVQYRRIPFRFLWLPLAKVQEGLGGKARAIALLVAVGLLALIGVLCLVPYPLKVESRGSLLPEERTLIFSPGKGYVEALPIKPGDEIKPGQDLVMIYDQDLREKIIQLQAEIRAADLQVRALAGQRSERSMTPQEQNDLDLQKITPEVTLQFKKGLLDNLLERFNAVKDRPGFLWVKAPKFADVRSVRGGDGETPADHDPVWTILTPDFLETLPRRPVEPKDPLLRLGNNNGRWEVEMKIPQKHIGQVLQAYQYLNTDTLDVDLIVKSESTGTYKGKLERSKIAGEATPHRDETEEAEPVVMAWVRIEGNDIPEGKRVPRELMLTGVEVHAKVRCGNHAMGYSLFYGVWEFFYEKVVFFF